MKKALCEANKTIIYAKLDECFKFIVGLRNTSGQLLIQSRKKTGFIGLLMSINSLKFLFEDLVLQKDIVKYIPTYKLSQDHIELFFGCVCIRSHGGHNNPTARQFKAAYKKMLIHSEIRATETGNCVPLEIVNILHITSNPIDTINMTCPTNRFNNEEEEEEDSLFSSLYVLPISQLSEFSIRVIVYISGFIMKRLGNKINCEQCKDAFFRGGK